jgi:hypothetical protein
VEERDMARQREEELFAEGKDKDDELERVRDGYVWVTDKYNDAQVG